MTIGIYCIEHVSSGKRYIGKSVNIEHRLWSHKYSLTKPEYDKKACNRHLYNAVQKYGWESFDTYVVQEFPIIDEDAISIAELFWMRSFRTTERKYGYNLRMDSSSKMIVHEETKLLLSVNNAGPNNPNFGNYWTDRQKSRMSEIAKRRHSAGEYGDEWKAKISKASSTMWKNEELKKQMAEKVRKAKLKYDFLQYTRDGTFVKKWGSIKEIVDENPSYKWQNIYSVCNGYKKTYMDYVWVKVNKI